MKSVMLSIKPPYCVLIASRKKNVEVRKTKPTIEVPFKCYIYQSGKALTKTLYGSEFSKNGYVIGEFVCDDIFPMWAGYIGNYGDDCLTYDEQERYFGGKGGYGWHISDLKIYDKPKDISEFYSKCNEGCEDCYLWQNVRVNSEECDMDCASKYYGHIPLKRPPQSWCYVEELK